MGATGNALSKEVELNMEHVLRKSHRLLIAVVATAPLLCVTTWAQDMKPFLTLKTAKAMAEAADKKASDMGIKVHIAIVDDGGNLKYYLRQDGAPLVAEKISQMKAFTAVAMEKSRTTVVSVCIEQTRKKREQRAVVRHDPTRK